MNIGPLLYRDSSIPNMTLWECLHDYIDTLPNSHTQKVYQKAFHQFFNQKFLDSYMTLTDFSKQNLELILDNIRGKSLNKNGQLASEATRETRSAAFIGFTTFLSRRSQGLIHKVQTNREGANKTFSHKKEHTAATTLSEKQRADFFSTLKGISMTGYLCACLQFQGARRISEVVECLIEDISWEENKVSYKPKKTAGIVKVIPVYYPKEVMYMLEEYLGERKSEKGYVFLDLKVKNTEEHLKICTFESY